MKLVGLVSILPACTYATFTQMAADFLKLQTLEENRGLGNAIGLQAFADIDGYGCWCHFEDDHGIGRGQAQDAIDNHCRTTHNGYSCAIMDHGSTAGFQSFFGVFFWDSVIFPLSFGHISSFFFNTFQNHSFHLRSMGSRLRQRRHRRPRGPRRCLRREQRQRPMRRGCLQNRRPLRL